MVTQKADLSDRTFFDDYEIGKIAAPMAPNYVNLLIDEFEQNLTNDCHKKRRKDSRLVEVHR